MFKLVLKILVLCVAWVATNSFAFEVGFYANVGAGYSGSDKIDFQSQKITFNGDGSNGFGWKANIGYMFMPLVGVDLGYTQYTSDSYSGNNGKKTPTLSGYHAALIGRTPISLPFFLYGKLGVGNLSRDSFEINNIKVASESTYNIYWAMGSGYALTDNLFAQLEFEQTQGRHNNPSSYLASLGIGYQF